MKCTWEGCEDEAAHQQIAKDGDIWANLCGKHNDRLKFSTDPSLETFSIPKMMSDWVAAQGGSKAAAARMMAPKKHQESRWTR